MANQILIQGLIRTSRLLAIPVCLLAVAAVTVLLAGCMTMADVETGNDGVAAGKAHSETGPTNESRCPLEDHRLLVGEPLDQVDTEQLPRPLRIYTVDSPITMDHRPDRLNIVTDRNGRIVRVNCG